MDDCPHCDPQGKSGDSGCHYYKAAVEIERALALLRDIRPWLVDFDVHGPDEDRARDTLVERIDKIAPGPARER